MFILQKMYNILWEYVITKIYIQLAWACFFLKEKSFAHFLKISKETFNVLKLFVKS